MKPSICLLVIIQLVGMAILIFSKRKRLIEDILERHTNIREPEGRNNKRITEVPKISSDDSCRKRNFQKAQRISINQLSARDRWLYNI
jgi:hypothetical protein